MRHAVRAALVLLLATSARVTLAAPSPAGPPAAPVVRVNGVPCVAAGELARLLDGVQYWRADTRKLVIRVQGHRLTLTEGVPIALLDDRTLRLDAPVTSVGGELQVPLSLLPQLPRDSSGVLLVVDAGERHVRVAPAAGYVGGPRVTMADDVTRVTILAAHADEARITSRDRGHFRVWLPGAPGGGAPDTLPAGALVRSLRRLPAGEGVVWELALEPGTAGWRQVPSQGQQALVLEFSRAGGNLERFAASGPEGPRSLRVVAIDPGHGGTDAGVTATTVLEKDLTLQLARLLASELERRAGARVVLTRDTDRPMAQPERAEIANRARADVVLSLHFDGAPLTRARGATAWCPPLSDGDAAGGPEPGEVLVPWRDVGRRYAGSSRALADAVTEAMESRGLGPARVRERLPVALLGVNAPGLLLECATLTSADDLARVGTPDGLRSLASAIADGVIAWARHD